MGKRARKKYILILWSSFHKLLSLWLCQPDLRTGAAPQVSAPVLKTDDIQDQGTQTFLELRSTKGSSFQSHFFLIWFN